MAARGRTIVTVSGEGTNTAVTVRSPIDGARVIVSPYSLTRPELIGACAVRFPGAPRHWTKYTNELLVKALCDNSVEGLPKGSLNDPATPAQRRYVTNLGGYLADNATTRDADQEIKRLLGQTESKQAFLKTPYRPEAPEVNETPEVQIVTSTTPVSDIDLSAYVLQTDFRNEMTVVAEYAKSTREKLTAVITQLDDLRPTVIEVIIADRPKVTVTERQHKEFPAFLKMLGLVNPYLVGPPGTGKTTMVIEAAKVLDVPFAIVNCDPTMSPSEIFGYRDANGRFNETPVTECVEKAGIVLFDEIDKCHAGVLSKINGMIANRVVSYGGVMIPVHVDTMFVAAANTHGGGATKQHSSAMALDEATLDRFTELEVSYDEALETELTVAQFDDPVTHQWLSRVRCYRRNAAIHGVLKYFTPRASIDGAKLLRAGFTFDEVTKMRLNKGIESDTLRKLCEGC